MNSSLRWLAFAAAVMGLGLTLPSCPGNQAMQDQIDSVKLKESEFNKRIQSLDARIKAMNDELLQIKNVLEQVGKTVIAQKDALEKLDYLVKNPPQKYPAKVSTPRRATKSKGLRKKTR